MRRFWYIRKDGVRQRYWVKHVIEMRERRVREPKMGGFVERPPVVPAAPQNWLVLFSAVDTWEKPEKKGRKAHLVQWEATVRADTPEDAIIQAQTQILKEAEDERAVGFLTSARVGVSTERTGRVEGETLFRKQRKIGESLYVKRFR